jgi:vacuolar-type H+-ATPase subunit I/STV1
MSKIGMSCRGCTFNIKENEEQTSCQLGMLDTIKTKSSKCEIVDGDYQFDRVCNFRTTEEKTKEEILKERYIRFHFIIVDTDIDKTFSILDSIEDLVTEDNRVCLTTTENFKALSLKIGNKPNYFITNSFDEDKTVFEYMDDTFNKIKNGYTIVLHEDDKISKEDLDKVNEFINIKMNRLALIEDSPFVVNNVIFKMLKGNKDTLFKDKLVELQQEQEIDSMIFTWEDIDEGTSL